MLHWLTRSHAPEVVVAVVKEELRSQSRSRATVRVWRREFPPRIEQRAANATEGSKVIAVSAATNAECFLRAPSKHRRFDLFCCACSLVKKNYRNKINFEFQFDCLLC